MEFRGGELEVEEPQARPYGEATRGEWMRSRFSSLGLEEVQTDDLGNVFGFLQKDFSQPAVGVSAHLDTVFPMGTRLETREEGPRLYGPGISDNAAGIVAGLAVASSLKRAQLHLAANIVFIANLVAEAQGNPRAILP